MLVFKKLKKFEEHKGLNLENFHIQEYTHLFTVDEDGYVKGSSYCLGFFISENLANQAMNEYLQQHGGWCKTEPVFILTDGKIGFQIGNPVEIR